VDEKPEYQTHVMNTLTDTLKKAGDEVVKDMDKGLRDSGNVVGQLGRQSETSSNGAISDSTLSHQEQPQFSHLQLPRVTEAKHRVMALQEPLATQPDRYQMQRRTTVEAGYSTLSHQEQPQFSHLQLPLPGLVPPSFETLHWLACRSPSTSANLGSTWE
jgi:hypothetical protein